MSMKVMRLNIELSFVSELLVHFYHTTKTEKAQLQHCKTKKKSIWQRQRQTAPFLYTPAVTLCRGYASYALFVPASFCF